MKAWPIAAATQPMLLTTSALLDAVKANARGTASAPPTAGPKQAEQGNEAECGRPETAGRRFGFHGEGDLAK